MHSWYLHRLFPVRRFNYKERKIEIQENYTTYNNTFGTFLNDSGKSWFKVEEQNYTSDAEWSIKFEQREKEDIAIWLPVIMLSLVLFLYNVGLGSVPYVLISELFAVNVSIALISLRM